MFVSFILFVLDVYHCGSFCEGEKMCVQQRLDPLRPETMFILESFLYNEKNLLFNIEAYSQI